MIDYNGDGDGFDKNVLHRYNLQTGNLVNLGIAGSSFECEGHLFAITVKEPQQGHTDLNGDGDHRDTVLHVYDFLTGEVINTGLAITDSGNPGIRRLEVGLDRVLFVATEAQQGGTDLNGDGDGLDDVVHIFDSRTREVTSLNLAIANRPDVTSGFELRGSLLSFPVEEFDQGFTDLNGDGDFLDVVPIVFDPSVEPVSMTVVPIALPSHDSHIRGSGTCIAYRADESASGERDLDGNGRIQGFVPFVFDASSGRLTNLGVVTGWGVQVEENRVSYVQVNDRLVYDARTGISFDTGASSGNGALTEFLFLSILVEANEGIDLNGDGDQLDRVVHVSVLDRALGAGSVNAGAGPVTDILTVSGKTGTVTVPVGAPFEVGLNAPPQDVAARYLLWSGQGRPSRETELRAPGGELVGRLVNALPFGLGLDPRPIACIRSRDFLPSGCSGSRQEIIGPMRAPWSRTDPGFVHRIDLTVQGIIEDSGSANALGLSVTNAIIVQAR